MSKHHRQHTIYLDIVEDATLLHDSTFVDVGHWKDFRACESARINDGHSCEMLTECGKISLFATCGFDTGPFLVSLTHDAMSLIRCSPLWALQNATLIG